MTAAEVHQLAIDIQGAYRDLSPRGIFTIAIEGIRVKALSREESGVLRLLVRTFIAGQQSLDREQAYLDAMEALSIPARPEHGMRPAGGKA